MMAALGIMLLVAGAIVLFAVDRSAEGVDLMAIGWILLAGGGLSLLVSLIQAAGSQSEQRTTMVTDHTVSADGRHFVDELRRG
jgi:hypothetical protein